MAGAGILPAGARHPTGLRHDLSHAERAPVTLGRRSVGLDGRDELRVLLRLGRGGALRAQQRGGGRDGRDDQAGSSAP